MYNDFFNITSDKNMQLSQVVSFIRHHCKQRGKQFNK